jgi:hypothetical protein
MTQQFAMVPMRALRCNLGTRAWRVLVVICGHAGPDHIAYPGFGRIAQLTGIECCKVPEAIAELESEGLLRRLERSKGGRGMTNRYLILFEDTESVATRTTDSGVGGRPADNRNRQPGVLRLTDVTIRPVVFKEPRVFNSIQELSVLSWIPPGAQEDRSL